MAKWLQDRDADLDHLMEIRLLDEASVGTEVRFESPVGPSTGRWRGGPTPAGSQVDVEFDFATGLRWPDEIGPAASGQEIGFDADGFAILGIEEQHHGGVLVARFGSAVVLLTTRGPVPPIVGILAAVRADGLALYPTGI